MANFNTDRWYQLTVQSHPGQDMDGTTLYNQGKGAVFFQITNTSLAEHQWQLFPFNSSTYVLRSKASGPQGFLGAEVTTSGATAGNTVPYVANSTLSDNSMFWQISPWGDGTFYLTNLVNGSAWHLMNNPNSLMVMSSNITAPQPGQRFSFTALGAIDDKRFSSVVTAAATTTSSTSSSTNGPATNSATLTSSPTPTTSSGSTSGGLSTAAAAGIGASLGFLALIAILVAAYLLYRRSKRRGMASSTEETKSQNPSYDDPVKPKLQSSPSELHSETLSTELPGAHEAHELPAEAVIPHQQAQSR